MLLLIQRRIWTQWNLTLWLGDHMYLLMLSIERRIQCLIQLNVLMLVSLLFMNAILGVYLHTCRLSSLVRKVLMVEVLLENFSSFFFNSFPLFTLMVLDASSIMLQLFRYFVLKAGLLLLIYYFAEWYIFLLGAVSINVSCSWWCSYSCFFSFSIFISLWKEAIRY